MERNATPDYLALAEYVSAHGCPLVDNGLRMNRFGQGPKQVMSAAVNLIIDLYDGQGAAYIIDLEVDSKMLYGRKLKRIQIKTPWGSMPISLLRKEKGCESYEFPGNALMYESSVVLNHFLSGKVHPEREKVEGLLLGLGNDPISEKCPEHGVISAELCMFDLEGDGLSAGLRLSFDRSASCLRERKQNSLVERKRPGRRVRVA